MFRSLLHRWNRFAPPDLRLDTRRVQQAAESATVTGFELATRTRLMSSSRSPDGRWRERHKSCCVGWLELPPADRDAGQVLTPLAGYAEAAGVGYLTTHGFGAVSVEVW